MESYTLMNKLTTMRTLILTMLAVLSMHLSAISYQNPILPYDYSDPDAIRVGDTYLMTSSSFNNIPGLQILASKDLVHWDIVDAALPYRLPGYVEGDSLLGRFVWAPAIREHDGMLYIYYGDPDRGIYCVRADISSGLHFPLDWQEAVLVMPAKGFIDPCPLWDEDGRVWLCHAAAGSRYRFKSVIMMAELTADGLRVKTPSRIIFDGHAEHPTCEGPKLYKRNGYYYIMHPAGGVSTGWQVVQRSRSIYGPYELRVTLRQGSTAINGPHQGAWVDTPEGEHWFLHFQDVGIAGRLVHLQPMRWQDDWPLMGTAAISGKNECGEPVEQYGTPKKGTRGWTSFARRDDFDQNSLALDWQFAGGHIEPRWYFCHAAESLLRLYSAPATAELMPNMLLQKIPATAFTMTARVRFMPNENKKMAGAEKAGMIVFGRQSFTLEVPASKEWMYVRLRMDDKQQGTFYLSYDGMNWIKSGETFQAVEGQWIGAQVGFFCTRDNRVFNDAGWLDIDWAEIKVG